MQSNSVRIEKPKSVCFVYKKRMHLLLNTLYKYYVLFCKRDIVVYTGCTYLVSAIKQVFNTLYMSSL